jgi:hypothetical protein
LDLQEFGARVRRERSEQKGKEILEERGFKK